MAHTYSHLCNLVTTALHFLTVCGPWGRPDLLPLQPGDVPSSYANVDDLVNQFHYKAAPSVERGEPT